MATQVPYSGAPEVSPELRPLSSVGVNSPLAAFGGATAQATEGFGKALAGAGTELFNRAAAMQQLNEQARASEAASDFTTQLGQLHADFTSKQGKDAVDSYQGYIAGVNSLRQKIRDGLGSDFARKTYDQESRFMQARAIWSAAGYVGSQNRQFILGASQARIDTAANAALITPEDEEAFQHSIETTKSEIQHQAQLGGWDPDKTNLESANAVSKLWSARIQGLAKTAPFTAQRLLDKAIQDKQIVGSDLAALQDFVKKQQYTTGARAEAGKIMAGNSLAFGEGRVPIDKAAMAIGGFESHNNYAAVGPETKTMGHGLGKFQTMSKNLAPWLAEAGMPTMTESQFLADGAAQEKLFAFKFGQYMDEYGSFNNAAKMWFAGTTNPKPGANDATSTTKGTTVPGYLSGTNAILARGASASDLSNAARARAQQLAPNDPTFGDYLEQHTMTLHNNQMRIQREDEFNNRQTIENALVTGQQNGAMPTTVEDLTIDPDVKLAWDALKPSDQRKYMGVLAKNAKGDIAWTPDSLKSYQKMVGAAIDPMRSPEDTEEFMKTDITTMDIPISAKRELIKMQMKVFKNQDAAPQMGHALAVLGPTLQAAGIDKKNKDDYNQFLGSLHEVMTQFLADNKAPPKDKDIQVMGSRLLQQMKTPAWYNPWSTTPMYQITVPDEAKKMITDSWVRQHGAMPTDQQIQGIYTASQYQNLYGKSRTPSVPRPGQ